MCACVCVPVSHLSLSALGCIDRLLDLVAEDSAIDDVLDQLTSAFDEGKLALATYLKVSVKHKKKSIKARQFSHYMVKEC